MSEPGVAEAAQPGVSDKPRSWLQMEVGGPSSLGGPTALSLGGAVLFLAIAYLPGLWSTSYAAPRPIVFLGGTVGLVLLGRQARGGNMAARWLSGFVLAALISGVLADQPWSSILSALENDQGWIYLAAYAGWWALGLGRGNDAKRLVAGAIVVGGLANTLLCGVQIWVGGAPGLLDMSFGRPTGFMGNPIYAGQFMAGSAALAVTIARDNWKDLRRRWIWVTLFGVLVLGVNLTGTRSALGAVAVVAVFVVRKLGWRPVLIVLVVMVAAIGVSSLLTGTSGAGRLAETGGGGGLTPRVEMWKAGAQALSEKPVFGWGPNRFAAATTHRTTLERALAEAGDYVFNEAHNLVVDLTVTTGIVGIILFGGFMFYATRGSAGRFGTFSAAIGLVMLLEPTRISVAPVAMLALGLSTNTANSPSPLVSDSHSRGAKRVVPMVAGLVGLGFGMNLLIADALVGRSLDAHNTKDSVRYLERAERLVSWDQTLRWQQADALGRMARETGQGGDKVAAVAASQQAVNSNPASYLNWMRFADFELEFGEGHRIQRVERAKSHLKEAYERNPWATMVLIRLFELEKESGNCKSADIWAEKLCLLNHCPPRPCGPKS